MAEMTREQIVEIVRQELASNGREFVIPHSHNGIDSPQIDPDFLLGFPIFSATPAHAAPDGTIVLSDISGTRKIWARIGGAWYSITVT